MQTILQQELRAFGAEPRPWPEENLLPTNSGTGRGAISPRVASLRSLDESGDGARAKSSSLVQGRGVKLLKLAQRAAESESEDAENGSRQPPASSPLAETPNTLFEQVRLKRARRKSNLALLRRLVTKVVEQRMNSMGEDDSGRARIVLENSIRTVEGLHRERIDRCEALDETLVCRDAERVCAMNIKVLFNHEPSPSSAPLTTAATSSSQLVLRIPLAPVDFNKTPTVATPIPSARKDEGAMMRPLHATGMSRVLAEDQYVTPIIKRVDSK